MLTTDSLLGVVPQHGELEMPTKQSSGYDILQYSFPKIVRLQVIPNLQYPLSRVPAPSLGRRFDVFLGHNEIQSRRDET